MNEPFESLLYRIRRDGLPGAPGTAALLLEAVMFAAFGNAEPRTCAAWCPPMRVRRYFRLAV